MVNEVFSTSICLLLSRQSSKTRYISLASRQRNGRIQRRRLVALHNRQLMLSAAFKPEPNFPSANFSVAISDCEADLTQMLPDIH
jgi:hypothetical protein